MKYRWGVSLHEFHEGDFRTAISYTDVPVLARWAKATKSKLARDVTIADFLTDGTVL